MKTIALALVLGTLSTSAFSQSLGGLLGRAANAVGGKADCTATYAVSKAGVFGQDRTTKVKQIKGRSIQDACEKAKKENDSDSGVFGNSTIYLESLACTIKGGVNVDVDVQTCESRI